MGQNSKIAIRILFFFALSYTILITAWIGDDAQITFRQVWNFISGDGITFNFDERVQAFTHPLWFLVISGITFITKELFLTTIIINLFFSLSAILILFKIEYDSNKGQLSYVSPIFLLIFSWAYIDYATSGLENALSNFLVSLLFLEISRKNTQKNICFVYSLLALLVLNRLDYSLLFLPFAIMLMFETKSVKHFLNSISFGCFLLFSWHIFATIYFGTPFSNTFYAKMNIDFPIGQVLTSGLNYIKSINTDLSTLIIIITGITVSFVSKNKHLISLSLGQVLYLLYILFIGGDFMLGRFFTILVFISVCQIVYSISLIQTRFQKQINYLLIFLISSCLINALSSNNFPSFSGRDYRPTRTAHYIGDERGGNYRFGGLFSDERVAWPKLTNFTDVPPSSYITVCAFLGAISTMNSSKYIIDQCAISNAFLAQIPPIKSDRWVSGHYRRKMPTGYGEFLLGKISELPDKKLNDLLKDVQLMIKGDLFTVERWKSIWRVNTKFHRNIDYSEYTNKNVWIPKSLAVEEITLANWDQEIDADKLSPRLNHSLKFFNGNLSIKSNTPRMASALWFYIDFSYRYDIYVNEKLMFENISQDWEDCNGIILKLPREEKINTIKFLATELLDLEFSDSNRIRYMRLLTNDNLEAVENQSCIQSLDFKPY